jgi:uncharacterized protein (DUF2141 family)
MNRAPRATLITAALMALPLVADAGDAELVARVSARDGTGRVRCAAFADARGFPKDAKVAVATIDVPVVRGMATCVFTALPQGTYAIAAYHDENGNGRLDENFLGMPKEGFGFSRNPDTRFGPPKFDAAAVAYSGATIAFDIQMKY